MEVKIVWYGIYTHAFLHFQTKSYPLPHSFYLPWCALRVCVPSIICGVLVFGNVTPGILSRVFLFHFEKILDHFGLFRVFRDVSVNTSWNSRFGLKKKILKTKTNLHFVHQKTSKGKKKWKEKKWTKVPVL